MAVTISRGITIDTPERQHKIYRLLVENSLGLMCIHDLAGVLHAINPAVAESLGYRPEQGPGRNLRDFLAPETRHLFDGYLSSVARKGTDTGLMRLLASDGTERIWIYRCNLYEEDGGTPIVLGHALDITARATAEQALKDAKTALADANERLAARVRERTAELEQANLHLRAEIEQRKRMEDELLQARKLESLGVMAGGIAHDFNNFLTVVQGNIELARMDPATDGNLRDILDQTMTACQRAAQLSSQLLIFARGGTPVRRVVSVASVISEAVNLARAGSSVSIEVDIAPELLAAEIDVGQIGQVLHNILLNARQAMPLGGLIQIRAENVVAGGEDESHACEYVRMSIRDYGHGIRADDLPRVFDPYFTTKATGNGLGLATAYAIVGKHGGRLSVTSKEGEGSIFTIDLPASHSRPDVPVHAATAPKRGSGRLLVMDDEEGLRQLLKRVLTGLGYEVECAANGAEAVILYDAARASWRGFDAVLLDLTVVGGMGGLETAAKLREIDGAARLIASSGYSDGAVMADFRQYGFDDVIPKPWTPAELANVFARALAPSGSESME